MQLLFLLLLLVTPYLLLSVLGIWISRCRVTRQVGARIGISLFFIFTGVGHFIVTEQMSAMLPDTTPYRRELIYLTGVFEIMGAIGVWIPRLMRLTGVCLILLLIGVLPANVYAAIQRVDFGGHAAGPVYLLLRVPFQVFVIYWTYVATDQNWFRRPAPTPDLLDAETKTY